MSMALKRVAEAVVFFARRLGGKSFCGQLAQASFCGLPDAHRRKNANFRCGNQSIKGSGALPVATGTASVWLYRTNYDRQNIQVPVFFRFLSAFFPLPFRFASSFFRFCSGLLPVLFQKISAFFPLLFQFLCAMIMVVIL